MASGASAIGPTSYGLRAGVVEAILILGLTLLAAPLRSWLEKSFRALFERETALYREVVARIGTRAGKYRQLPDLLSYIESQTASSLSLRRVKIVLRDDGLNGAGAPAGEANGQDAWLTERLFKAVATNG